jgi:predicted CXXCH cytochrome family protein
MRILTIAIRDLLTTILLLIALESSSAAFHDGGVGECVGCHSIHGSDVVLAGGPSLLRAQDTSSACLYCHQQVGDSGPTNHHVSTPASELPQGTPPKQLTPGGDFGWLMKNYSWVPGPSLPTAYSNGDRHGHNIVAVDFLYDPDSTYTVAPGGTYPSAQLSCISCHDPHGRYRRNFDGSISTSGSPIVDSGSFASSPQPQVNKAVGVYRLLGGKGYLPKSMSAGFGFVNDPPAAVAPDSYNRSEAATQTRVAYGAGMSEWCQNCHPDMHTTAYPGNANLLHPSGNSAKLGSIKAGNYNSYIKTGDLTGLASRSYLSLVPFEEGTTDYPTLKLHAKSDDSSLAGPDNITSQVMCLTCHRAHASGWDGSMRWNADTDFIESNGYYAQEGQPVQPYGQGRTEAEALRAYYDRPERDFASSQDSLCNKCHVGTYP